MSDVVVLLGPTQIAEPGEDPRMVLFTTFTVSSDNGHLDAEDYLIDDQFLPYHFIEDRYGKKKK